MLEAQQKAAWIRWDGSLPCSGLVLVGVRAPGPARRGLQSAVLLVQVGQGLEAGQVPGQAPQVVIEVRARPAHPGG